MIIKQIAPFVNDVLKETTGKEGLIKEDLSNVVDIGEELPFDDDNFFRSTINGLVDRIGRQIFVARKYRGNAPSVYMDSWEYGSIAQKISSSMPESIESENWNLVDGQSYAVDVYHGSDIRQKFFNKKVTFTVVKSIVRNQLKEAFSSASALSSFIDMLFNEVEKRITVDTDNLIMRAINNMTGETIANAFPGGTYTGAGNARAVNLLKLYNDSHAGATIATAKLAIMNPDFIRFATAEISKTMKRMRKISSIYNVGGQDRFTPSDMLKVVMHGDFSTNADVFLQSDVYHNELTKLPESYDDVPFWQGSGTGYDFDVTSKIKIKTASGKDVECGGILAVMFDREALGVTNKMKSVRSQYNANGDFTNYWYESDAQYFNDLDENFVVFFAA